MSDNDLEERVERLEDELGIDDDRLYIKATDCNGVSRYFLGSTATVTVTPDEGMLFTVEGDRVGTGRLGSVWYAVSVECVSSEEVDGL